MQKIISRNILFAHAFMIAVRYIQKHHNPNHRDFTEIQNDFLGQARETILADRAEKEKENKRIHSEKSKGKTK